MDPPEVETPLPLVTLIAPPTSLPRPDSSWMVPPDPSIEDPLAMLTVPPASLLESPLASCAWPPGPVMDEPATRVADPPFECFASVEPACIDISPLFSAVVPITANSIEPPPPVVNDSPPSTSPLPVLPVLRDMEPLGFALSAVSNMILPEEPSELLVVTIDTSPPTPSLAVFFPDAIATLPPCLYPSPPMTNTPPPTSAEEDPPLISAFPAALPTELPPLISMPPALPCWAEPALKLALPPKS